MRAALDKVDPTQIVARMRQAAVARPGMIPDSMLPGCRGQDYPALKEARRAASVKGDESAAQSLSIGGLSFFALSDWAFGAP